MSQPRSTIVTGGAGFIGSHLVRHLLAAGHRVLNIDKLTYAGNTTNLAGAASHPAYTFLHADIADAETMKRAFADFRPDRVFHLAAESHVDRSISSPMEFLHTNVIGTASLLQAARAADLPEDFRFIHVSTDEVYGALGKTGSFTENTSYDPRSPYSASKAASDHLVRAWAHTYQLPVILTHSANNHGTHQYPEKLIPLTIGKARRGEPAPVYGDGCQIRDWLHVSDHCAALVLIAEKGRAGETYNIGANDEWRNIDLVKEILRHVAEMTGLKPALELVQDRPGHDFRYSIDATKLQSELGWQPLRTIADSLQETVQWYLDEASPGVSPSRF